MPSWEKIKYVIVHVIFLDWFFGFSFVVGVVYYMYIHLYEQIVYLHALRKCLCYSIVSSVSGT